MAKFYSKQGETLQRTQLLLLPCWAATLHKVWGLSLDAAIIDLGPKMFEDGMAYVALSRVRTLQIVALLGLVEKKSHHQQ
uniref:ATP-dependent DNA helicase n=1 Tax=Amphimedon queenslandica TaxID=400682 RepID=A0A1X7VQT2_AMPQE